MRMATSVRFLLFVASLIPYYESAWITNHELEGKSEEIRASCELERLFAKDFLTTRGVPDSNKFVQTLQSLAKPVVVEGAVDNWVALKRWKDQEYFLNTFGQVRVDASSLHKGNPSVPLDKKGPDTLLKDFVTNWKDKDQILFQLRGLDQKSLVMRFARDLRNETGSYAVTATPPLLLSMKYPSRVLSMGPPTEVLVGCSVISSFS